MKEKIKKKNKQSPKEESGFLSGCLVVILFLFLLFLGLVFFGVVEKNHSPKELAREGGVQEESKTPIIQKEAEIPKEPELEKVELTPKQKIEIKNYSKAREKVFNQTCIPANKGFEYADYYGKLGDNLSASLYAFATQEGLRKCLAELKELDVPFGAENIQRNLLQAIQICIEAAEKWEQGYDEGDVNKLNQGTDLMGEGAALLEKVLKETEEIEKL